MSPGSAVATQQAVVQKLVTNKPAANEHAVALYGKLASAVATGKISPHIGMAVMHALYSDQIHPMNVSASAQENEDEMFTQMGNVHQIIDKYERQTGTKFPPEFHMKALHAGATAYEPILKTLNSKLDAANPDLDESTRKIIAEFDNSKLGRALAGDTPVAKSQDKAAKTAAKTAAKIAAKDAARAAVKAAAKVGAKAGASVGPSGYTQHELDAFAAAIAADHAAYKKAAAAARPAAAKAEARTTKSKIGTDVAETPYAPEELKAFAAAIAGNRDAAQVASNGAQIEQFDRAVERTGYHSDD